MSTLTTYGAVRDALRSVGKTAVWSDLGAGQYGLAWTVPTGERILMEPITADGWESSPAPPRDDVEVARWAVAPESSGGRRLPIGEHERSARDVWTPDDVARFARYTAENWPGAGTFAP